MIKKEVENENITIVIHFECPITIIIMGVLFCSGGCLKIIFISAAKVYWEGAEWLGYAWGIKFSIFI